MNDQPWLYTLCETTLGAEEAEAARATVESAWLSTGPRTQAFEKAFAEKLGARHAIAVSNGTAALHVATLALGIGPGDEVIQPSLTFVASANITIAAGAAPIFADIVSLDEPTIDPQDVIRRITPRTKAVVAMHFGGYPARLGELLAICRERGIALIEDACHGPAQRVPSLGGRALGTFGAVGTFSFFANKNMTTGEGGMVVSDDDEVAARVRLLRSHGMTTLSWDRHRGRASTYDVLEHGFNYRTNEIASAIGIEQLKKLDGANARRREVAATYARCFREAAIEGVHFVFGDRPDEGAGHIAALIVPQDRRDGVRAALTTRRIQTSLHYPPIHLFSGFAGKAASDLDLTEEFSRRVISLPIHPLLMARDAEIIANTVIEIIRDLEV